MELLRSFAEWELVIPGLMLLISGFLLWRNVTSHPQEGRADPSKARPNQVGTESAAQRLPEKLNSRPQPDESVAGESTSAKRLSRLVDEAEQLHDRLDALLTTSGPRTIPIRRRPDIVGPTPEPTDLPSPTTLEFGLSARQRRMAKHLIDAGFSVQEVARCVNCTANEIESLWERTSPPESHAA